MPELLDHPVPFGGGVRLAPEKGAAAMQPVRTLPVPGRLIIPLKQHHGSAAEPIVKLGQRVGKGQCIARHHGYISAPVHASSSGAVVDIDVHPLAGAFGPEALSVVIDTDGEDRWAAMPSRCPDYRQLSSGLIQQRILEAGIAGMGGAGFPAAVKLIPGWGRGIDILLLNAAECEPYISCDQAAIRRWPERVIIGLEILRHAVQPKCAAIGIEDNVPELAAILRRTIEQQANGEIRLREVASLYPAGGERQLIRSLTGRTVPDQALPMDMGVLIYNVGTVCAIYNAIVLGEPSISRIVTVAGPGAARPGNLEVLLGAPIRDVLDACAAAPGAGSRVIMGGPMMGYAVPDLMAPVVKTSNCLLLLAPEGAPDVEQPCIRCGDCAPVCPEALLPHELLRHARESNWPALQDERLFACIECGCCSYVCPSRISLVDVYRRAKSDVLEMGERQQQADAARTRHQARQQRRADEQTRAGRQRQTVPDRQALQDEIAAALRRRQARRDQARRDRSAAGGVR